MIKLPCHIIDTEADTNTEMFWDGHILLDGNSLHVEMHGRPGMGPLHTAEGQSFDVPMEAIDNIQWKDRVVGSLVEISFRERRHADQFPGTRDGHTVNLSIPEFEDGLAERFVRLASEGIDNPSPDSS